MVSYVILIVIGVTLSVGVYSYLKLHLPPKNAECPSNINLIIEGATCTASTDKLSLTLSNNGLFNVSAAFIRIGELGRKVKPQVNENEEILEASILPGGQLPTLQYPTPFNVLQGQTYVVEVQPAIVINKKVIPCESIITQEVVCS